MHVVDSPLISSDMEALCLKRTIIGAQPKTQVIAYHGDVHCRWMEKVVEAVCVELGGGSSAALWPAKLRLLIGCVVGVAHPITGLGAETVCTARLGNVFAITASGWVRIKKFRRLSQGFQTAFGRGLSAPSTMEP